MKYYNIKLKMTDIVYNSDSIGKIISIFAIECAIVFGFIILIMFCCTGSLFSSSNSGLNDTNKFMFKKYSSKYKIPNSQINVLYQKENNNKEKKTKSKSKSLCSTNFTNIFNCFSSAKSNKNNTVETNTVENENKEQLLSIDLVEKETNDKNNIDLESGLDLSKIYIVYEFNNLDNQSYTSTYIESESADEFDELEKFVNMILKSFESKYDKVGILLKISSPGGSAFKFEHAYLNLQRLRDKKIELIGLVDKMAASGGYMLASACDKIICSRYATIGSIGVIAQMYNWAELNKKVGLEEKTWTTGNYKNPFPTGSAYTDEDNERIKEMIGETFNIFKSIVEESRKFTPSQLEEILKAKTFPGFEALKLNMVDELELSSDYLDKLDETNNIWICEKEKKSKSFINSILMENIKFFGIKIIERIQDKIISDKKINNIKLL